MRTTYTRGLDSLATPPSRRVSDDVIGAEGDAEESTSSTAIVLSRRGGLVRAGRPWRASSAGVVVDDGITQLGGALFEMAVLVVALGLAFAFFGPSS